MSQVSTLTKKKLTVRGQRTRLELLEAAEQVFGERGFEHSSISEITRRAGVALGTFYVYFPHKQAIFTELVDELGERLRETLNAASKDKTTRLEKERAGFRAFFEFAGKHRNLYRIVRQAEFVDAEVYHRYYKRLATSYSRGLTRAMQVKDIGTYDTEVIAYALMGIADFIGMRFVVWEDPAALERVTDEVVHFIQYGLLSPQRLGPLSGPLPASYGEGDKK
ncbi:MAG: TetR/AcrR family transcriptional regulator [Archangium gephyra]|uniref:TetR/AcrR family transcriptional regulator n=1 Tax=Archangium gephyra TaxID=48 RepID=A0A2W5VH12_9BACT|nr:MAG: TetR/AcrR family transcriptional regulator [Archangium gephyra]